MNIESLYATLNEDLANVGSDRNENWRMVCLLKALIRTIDDHRNSGRHHQEGQPT